MKTKLLAVAVAVFITSAATAQKMTYDAGKTTFGIRAGVNFQNITGDDISGNKMNNDLIVGFNGGLNAEVPVGSGFYLQPGVLFTQKGSEYASDYKIRINYLEVPVNFIYKPILGTGRMLLGFGPYVGFGVGGKAKIGTDDPKIIFENSSPTYNHTAFKRIDGGANFLAGYEFANNFSFQINAQLGLTEINPTIENIPNDQSKLKNTGFGVSLGKRF